MTNERQLSILKQGVDVWNKWRDINSHLYIDLGGHDVKLNAANLSGAHLNGVDLAGSDLSAANLWRADLREANLWGADLSEADLGDANLQGTNLREVNFRDAKLTGSEFSQAMISDAIFANLDMSEIIGLEYARHFGPSSISTDTFTLSKGKISEDFLRGCGLSDADIEYSKLPNPDLSNEDINKILYKIYDLRATQALQISPLFISYSHADNEFVDKIDKHLTKTGIRFWRDIHEMSAGRIETQIDRGIRQHPTVLLVLSEHAINSDWVEHEVRIARQLEKDMERDVLCPVALDDSWKSSRWPKRIMEQIKEYNILDFSAWKDNVKFEGMFRKLIDGLALFYKG